MLNYVIQLVSDHNLLILDKINDAEKLLTVTKGHFKKITYNSSGITISPRNSAFNKRLWNRHA